MSLISLSYSEYMGEPNQWEVLDASFTDINLIVGKNSSGKSRLLSVIYSLAALLSGKRDLPYEACQFIAIIKIKGQEFKYKLEFKDSLVVSEELEVAGNLKLNRGLGGGGIIRYEKEEKFLDFKLPADAVAAVNRRDEIQHPFLIDLNAWANQVILYLFGSDLGKSRLMGFSELDSSIRTNLSNTLDDQTNIVGVYSAAYTKYGDEFDAAIISDMGKLGYKLDAVGSDNIQSISKFPIAAITMYTTESELGFQNSQVNMSQGMFRALALCIHLNLCAFSKNKEIILIDDIGEGLDYERSVAMIDLLIEKAKANDMQLFMTTNDRFIMNKIPLEYWSILQRRGGQVKTYNSRNSQKQFENFKYLGLNNFDFFASDYINSEP